MKRSITKLIMSLFLITGMSAVMAQDYGSQPDMCKQKLSLFHESVKAKNYDGAYENWKWTFENCPKASMVIYSDGLKIADYKYKNAAAGEKEAAGKLIDDIYEKRIQNYPKNLGKVYSDWAISLEERNGDKNKIFDKLDKAFKADPTGMSIKNIAKYFQEVTNRNKDTNVQLIFDTYDDAVDGVNDKIEKLTAELDKINEKDSLGKSLTSKEKRKQKNNAINLKGLGQVEPVLDQIISDVATCERLIPLYEKNFEANKTDPKWLKRAVSRLFNKECTDTDLYPKMTEAWVKAEPSAGAYVFYAKILEDRGESSKALKMRDKAVDLETDPYKKAKLLLRIAYTMRHKSKSQARNYAYKALKYQSSLGDAYLLIANLYGSSANSCGTDEFSKRMVYVAAANKAAMAAKVDPSVASKAKRAMRGYMNNAPSTKLIFQEGKQSGTPYKVGCWIGETVRIP
ncbi:MAG: hypothetical protein CR989_01445 [Flavobacteriales bacterium]|nr:MAG: hypothetical protein CR989_01445 [Flavobacteriales bacterium]